MSISFYGLHCNKILGHSGESAASTSAKDSIMGCVRLFVVSKIESGMSLQPRPRTFERCCRHAKQA